MGHGPSQIALWLLSTFDLIRLLSAIHLGSARVESSRVFFKIIIIFFFLWSCFCFSFLIFIWSFSFLSQSIRLVRKNENMGIGRVVNCIQFCDWNCNQHRFRMPISDADFSDYACRKRHSNCLEISSLTPKWIPFLSHFHSIFILFSLHFHYIFILFSLHFRLIYLTGLTLHRRWTARGKRNWSTTYPTIDDMNEY